MTYTTESEAASFCRVYNAIPTGNGKWAAYERLEAGRWKVSFI